MHGQTQIKYQSHICSATGQHSRPQFHLPPLGSLASLRHLAAKVGTSKGRGKQWQTTPKNLPRIQRTRAIPVDWLSSGLCPNRPKGWIPVIIIIIIICSALDWIVVPLIIIFIRCSSSCLSASKYCFYGLHSNYYWSKFQFSILFFLYSNHTE